MDNVAEESSGLTEEIRMKRVTQDNKRDNITDNSLLSTELHDTSEHVSMQDSFKSNLDGQEETMPNKAAKRKTSLVNKLRKSFYQYRSRGDQKFSPDSKETGIENSAKDSSVQEWPSEIEVDLDLSDPETNADNENEESENNAEGRHDNSCLSLFHIIKHTKLVAVTLQRKPEEEWGLKLSPCNKTDWDSRRQNETQVKDEETIDKGVTLKRPSKSPATTASSSAKKHPISQKKVNDPGKSGVGLRQNMLKRSVKRKLGRMKRSFSSIKRRHRVVYITGITEGGLADKCGQLAVEDLIVEVSFKTITVSLSC